MIPMMQIAPDFRRARYAEWCYSEHRGTYLAMLLSEELIEGRWEPFCAEIGCDGVFYEPFRGLDSFPAKPQKSVRPN